MNAPLLSVSQLTKTYGAFEAVRGISFALHPGEVLGLLGPNGAGKSTTIQMLLGLTTPTSGNISYFGMDFSTHRAEILSRINFVSAYTQLQGRSTVRQNIHVFSRIYGIPSWEEKMDELTTLLGVTDKLDTLCWHLSSGERTRVHMVKALLNDPEIILMDEPTASLDPEIVSVVLSLIANMQKKKKVAILYTSHNMTEVARVCDRVAFLDHGRIVVEDTPLGLSKRVGATTLEITFDGPDAPVVEYAKEHALAFEKVRPHLIALKVSEQGVPRVLFDLGKKRVWITDIDIKKPDLEDVFLAIAKGGADALSAH